MQKFSYRRRISFSVGIIFFVLLTILFPYSVLNGINLFGFIIEVSNYNELGDFIGGITAPFLSIFALLLLYWTYHSQKQELLETRKILNDQNFLITKQQFETTFFNMLNFHQQIIDAIKFKGSYDLEYIEEIVNLQEKEYFGRASFTAFFYIFLQKYRNRELDVKKSPAQRITFEIGIEKQLLSDAFSDFYIENEMYLGHYFRHIENLLKFIDSAQFSDKTLFFDIFRSQLSTYELIVIFYACLWSEKSELKLLVVKYKLLININQHHLNRMEDIQLIEKGAYE